MSDVGHRTASLWQWEGLRRTVFVSLGGGWYGIRIGRVYLSVSSPTHRPLFSERNRLGCAVIPLRGGWRFVARTVARV